MGELFYTELGSQAGSTVLQTHDSSLSLFQNFQPDLYWSETSNVDSSGNNGNKTFSFGNGYQGGNYEADQWFVIPVFGGNVLKVSNNHDSGAGSLRAEVAAAKPGDTIEFASTLSGSTINLDSTIDIDKPLYIVGLGTSKLTLSGQNAVSIFDIQSGGAGSDISNLTFTKGRSKEGGAIFDDGASLILNSDNFQQNQAVGKSAGAIAYGGALAVLGESATSLNVTIMNCQFTSNTSIGGAGGTGAGGALFVDFQKSSGASVSLNKDIFSKNNAIGGNGSTTAPSLSTGGSGGAGGAAEGGAIDMKIEASAVSAKLSITNSEMNTNLATGGNGGVGGGGLTGGNGGSGGAASGGAIFFDGVGAKPSDVWTLHGDTIINSVSQSGAGGNGASGFRGGSGGNSPSSVGGGIADRFVGMLSILLSTISHNSVIDGHAGKGGSGTTPGGKGVSSGGFGGGLYLDSDVKTDPSTLLSTIENNTADTGPNFWKNL